MEARSTTPPSFRSHPSPPVSPSDHPTGYRSVIASSINLVQSYRRSQLFVGDNLPNSFHESSFSTSYLSHPNHPYHPNHESDPDDDLATESHASLNDRDHDLDHHHEAIDRLSNLSDEHEDDQINLPSSFIPPNAFGSRRLTHRSSHNLRASQSSPHPHRAVFRPDSLRSPHPPNLQAGPATQQHSPYLANSLRRTSTTESASLLSPANRFPRYDSLSGPNSLARRYSTPRSSIRHRERLTSELIDSTEDARLLAHQTSTSDISHQSRPDPHVVPGIGTSTFGQSLFNAFNVLCGVGLLSEPLAFSVMGWIGGIILFIFCGLSTNYTAKILARLMAEDRLLLTYNDICYKAFGRSMQYPIAALFCLELFALSVALIVIFGDTLATIFPEVSADSFKILAFCLILPTVFMPFRILSYTSLLGLLSSLILVSVVAIDGLVKEEAPGSIFHPAKTSLKPSHKWGLSAGLMMSGFSGHSVMPSIAREMRNPHEFSRMLDYAYLAAGSMYMIIGLIGYLMFGDEVSQEITQDILRTPGYPWTINRIAIWMVGINPIAKFALCTRPLNVTIEHLLNLNTIVDLSDPHGPPAQKRPASIPPSDQDPSKNATCIPPDQLPPHSNYSEHHQAYHELPSSTRAKKSTIFTKAIGRVISRTLVTFLVVIVSILLPNFERVMSFLGAFAAFVICTILPISAEMILTRGQGRSPTTKVINLILLFVAIVMAIIGTTYSFLPKI